MSLNVSSPSPLYDENSNQSVDNLNKKNVSMINSNNPSSRPTLYNANVSNQNISNDENILKYSYEFKIILLGSVAVGKTAILARYITNEFNENHAPTIQANYKVKPIIVSNDAYAKLNIWDTSGNEKFRAITRQYYKDVQGIILVYDISNRESFESIDSWIEDIKNCAPKNSVIIFSYACEIIGKGWRAKGTKVSGTNSIYCQTNWSIKRNITTSLPKRFEQPITPYLLCVAGVPIRTSIHLS